MVGVRRKRAQALTLSLLAGAVGVGIGAFGSAAVSKHESEHVEPADDQRAVVSEQRLTEASLDDDAEPLSVTLIDAGLSAHQPSPTNPRPHSAEVGECFARALGSHREVLNWLKSVHHRARATCVRMRGIDVIGEVDPRDTCGDLDESLWNQSNEELASALRAINDFSDGNDALHGALWRDVDCSTLSEQEFGTALHTAVLAPNWIAPDFLRCAVLRESGQESFPLWAAMDAVAVVPESGEWVDGRTFQDERTNRRVRVLRGEENLGGSVSGPHGH